MMGQFSNIFPPSILVGLRFELFPGLEYPPENEHDNGKSHVFPIEHGDFPASHVSELRGVTFFYNFTTFDPYEKENVTKEFVDGDF